MEMKWAHSVIDQCRYAGVPVFMKQTGSVAARQLGYRDSKGGDASGWPQELRVRQFPAFPVPQAQNLAPNASPNSATQ